MSVPCFHYAVASKTVKLRDRNEETVVGVDVFVYYDYLIIGFISCVTNRLMCIVTLHILYSH
jgi:hypothetical protein